jgi:hypothetical protein
VIGDGGGGVSEWSRTWEIVSKESGSLEDQHPQTTCKATYLGRYGHAAEHGPADQVRQLVKYC